MQSFRTSRAVVKARAPPESVGSQAVAEGSCHSLEGVKLEEVSLRAGEARLLIRGKLLTADQDASILVTDFPLALLHPVFSSMPALQNAPPAASEPQTPLLLAQSQLHLALERVLLDLRELLLFLDLMGRTLGGRT